MILGHLHYRPSSCSSVHESWIIGKQPTHPVRSHRLRTAVIRKATSFLFHSHSVWRLARSEKAPSGKLATPFHDISLNKRDTIKVRTTQ